MYSCYFRDFHHSQRLDRLMHSRLTRSIDKYFPHQKRPHVITRVHAIRQGTDLRAPLYMIEVELRSQMLKKTLFLRKKGENLGRVLNEVCQKMGRTVTEALKKSRRVKNKGLFHEFTK